LHLNLFYFSTISSFLAASSVEVVEVDCVGAVPFIKFSNSSSQPSNFTNS